MKISLEDLVWKASAHTQAVEPRQITERTRDYIIAALNAFRGDDHIRAQRAFAGMTSSEMQQLHGASGKTRQQILSSYLRRVGEIDRAIVEVKSLSTAYKP